MDRPASLFMICDNCRAVLIIPQLIEYSLDRFNFIRCDECKHIHDDLVELKNFAKRTRAYE